MFDKSKYIVSKDTPVKWSQVTAEWGFREFYKEYLTNEDCEILIANKSQYVKRKEEKPAEA